VKINSTAILAGSPGAPIDPNGYVNPGEVESRRGRRDDWDDEDEEDW
jgi:hypothetical protein